MNMKLKNDKHWLEPSDFAQVVQNTPLVSIDLVLRDPGGAVLVGYRTFEPAKEYWFVPGGRIGKSETLDEAFDRITRAEIGVAIAREAARFLGVYEHFYETNRFNEPGYGTHYVVLGYEIALPIRPLVKSDDQHSAMKWMTPSEILADPTVHPNTQAYFAASLQL
jgi:colanic acid biosynthesis protein WcaH